MVVVIVPLTFLSHYRLPMSDCGCHAACQQWWSAAVSRFESGTGS